MLKKFWLTISGLFIILLLTFQLELFEIENIEQLLQLQSWIEDWGWLAPLFFVLLYSLAMLLFLPNSFFMVLSGLSFGPIFGSLFSLAGFMLGSFLSFIISRYFAQELVRDWLLKDKLLAKIERLMENYGWRIILVSRLVPIIPLNLQNYAYGLTTTSVSIYLVMSTVGILPKALLLSTASGIIIDEEVVLSQRPELIVAFLAIVLVYFLLYNFFLLEEEALLEKLED